MNSSEKFAYFIMGLSIVVFIGSFFIDKIDFKKPNKKSHH